MSEKRGSKYLTRREVLKLGGGAVAGLAAFGNIGMMAKDVSTPGPSNNQTSGIFGIGKIPADNILKVDFSYAFGTPHRITIGRPDASDRTLLDLQAGSLQMSWTYDNLSMAMFPPLAMRTPKTAWNIKINPQIDGNAFTDSRWTRLDQFLPGLENVYDNGSGSIRLEAISGMTAALIHIAIFNSDTREHQYTINCECNWGMNPAWVEPEWNPGDNIQAGWNDRADRVLILGLGADKYSLRDDRVPPGPQKMILVWNLKPGEKKQGWIIRPYSGYDADLPDLRKKDWASEMEHGKKEWQNLLGRASKMIIPDEGVSGAYMACLADLFIMREPLGEGHIVGVPGTEGYRAGNSGEPLIVAVALDQNGLHSEALAESSTSVNTQELDGCWADKKGWCHLFWAGAGFKSRAIMEHYKITGDKKYLESVYPNLLASSRWQEKQRARMRTGDREHSLTYGLMPRGFGDCGLMNDDDMYGVFFPHNIWAVYADKCSLEAAGILGKKNDEAELKKIYETSFNDLLVALDKGVIKEKGYRWIPGTPGKTTGSCWGTLNIAAPCELLPTDHELVTGTLRKIEENISKGGQPVHTGWMADGAWVAITLDNIAEVHLARGNGDAAVRYLYSTLNHGTPLYTWCEERGQEPGTKKTSGDLQHLWTPVAVVRALRDMMVMESGNRLNLALGTAREWLGSGNPVGISGACTHFGTVSYQMRYDRTGKKVTGEITFGENFSGEQADLYIRLPDRLKIRTVDHKSKATLLPDGGGLRWKTPQGTVKFVANV